jgi:hypothetical protein
MAFLSDITETVGSTQVKPNHIIGKQRVHIARFFVDLLPIATDWHSSLSNPISKPVYIPRTVGRINYDALFLYTLATNKKATAKGGSKDRRDGHSPHLQKPCAKVCSARVFYFYLSSPSLYHFGIFL